MPGGLVQQGASIRSEKESRKNIHIHADASRSLHVKSGRRVDGNAATYENWVQGSLEMLITVVPQIVLLLPSLPWR
jgi:hypothetical protein